MQFYAFFTPTIICDFVHIYYFLKLESSPESRNFGIGSSLSYFKNGAEPYSVPGPLNAELMEVFCS